jgi:hypothetical protein
MIVKIESDNGNKRFDHCVNASIIDDTPGPDGDPKRYCVIVLYLNGKDTTFPLSRNEKVFFMNDNGQTIDRDFRMLV